MFNFIPEALAADTTVKLSPTEGSGFDSLVKVDITTIISSGIQILLIVAAIIFFVMLLIGGIKWMLAGGDKGQTEAARGQVTAAMIGLVIVFAGWAIGNLLGNFFGIKIFDSLILPDFLP